uniref:ATP-dependent DNA helicase n=2 Tax=Onchocerca ochengi TaxID=42157 RepID=A0A182EY68_ONCOC
MAEDILHRIRSENSNMNMDFTAEIYNEALIMIEDLCLQIANKVLNQLGMPSPNRSAAASFDVELHLEQNYNIADLSSYLQSNISKLTLILATIRFQNGIALALASSGISATLLPGGRTAHSASKLPLNIQLIETPTCNISETSGMGKVLQKCKLIVWDECTMTHKKSVEALNRSLQDLRGNIRPFGNALILFAGDFRQTLPVIPRSTPADERNACLKYSTLWRHVKTFKLATNMRVQLQNDRSARIFSHQLLEIGN